MFSVPTAGGVPGDGLDSLGALAMGDERRGEEVAQIVGSVRVGRPVSYKDRDVNRRRLPLSAASCPSLVVERLGALSV